MWKTVRVAVLLAVLGLVAGESWYARHRVQAWRQTLQVGLFPVAGDGSPTTRSYVAALRRTDFEPLEAFFAEQAKSYGLGLDDPVRVDLSAPIGAQPPALATGAGPLSTLWWSLRLRYYAARLAALPSGRSPAVRVFLVYHDPALSPSVPHSAGLEKGLVGVVHAFAAPHMAGSNQAVIAHELLHTLGATDKYDPASNAPVYPDGYGDPDQAPRYPQRYAEIMAGRRALSPSEQQTPESLDECVIGSATAAEIHWRPR
jgi:hypothetical protein